MTKERLTELKPLIRQFAGSQETLRDAIVKNGLSYLIDTVKSRGKVASQVVDMDGYWVMIMVSNFPEEGVKYQAFGAPKDKMTEEEADAVFRDWSDFVCKDLGLKYRAYDPGQMKGAN